jgi:transcriptional regulator with XRE-family HTH domain
MNGVSVRVERQFGQAVRRLREQLHWSQERLAAEADLNRSYVGEIERGSVTASIATAAKLAAALEVSLSELLAGVQNPPQPSAQASHTLC